MVLSRLAKRTVSPAVAVMLVMGLVTIGIAVHAPRASAAGTVLFNQPFHDNTVDGPADRYPCRRRGPAAATSPA